MLRVPGLPKVSYATAKAVEPESPAPASSTTTRSRTAKEDAVTAEPTPIQSTPSTSKSATAATQLSRIVPTTTTPAQTTTQPIIAPVQNYSSHYPNAPYRQPMDPGRPSSVTPSTTQHTSSTSYTPATILPAYLYFGHFAQPSVESEQLRIPIRRDRIRPRCHWDDAVLDSKWDLVCEHDLRQPHHNSYFIHNRALL
jgi:hypothetical protein